VLEIEEAAEFEEFYGLHQKFNLFWVQTQEIQWPTFATNGKVGSSFLDLVQDTLTLKTKLAAKSMTTEIEEYY